MDKIFPTQINGAVPDPADIILFADTSDANATKDCAISALPISDATQTALNAKQNTLVSGDNIKSVNGTTLLGSGNINISAGLNGITVGQTGSGADYICDGIDDNIQIQDAINAINTAGGGIISIMEGVYVISGRMTPKSNVTIIGAGKGATTLIGGVVGDWMFYNNTAISNFSIKDITLDCNSTATGGLLGLNKITNGFFYNVEFKNVASGGWHAVVGIATVATAIDCFNNTFENCIFDTHSGSLEMLLLMNAETTKVINCTFKNKLTAGPVVGLYQQLKDTIFEGCKWEDNVGFSVYYSLSCDDTIFSNCYMTNVGGGFQGANLSDNGDFGETEVRGLTITDCFLDGGTNGINGVGIGLGAVRGLTVRGNTIKGFTIGINMADGNTLVSVANTNYYIGDNEIYDNTASDVSHVINPGIFFNSIGGSQYGTLSNNAIYDSKGTPTQRYPIVFDGAFTWDNINIIDNRLSAYSGADSITLSGGAALGSNVVIRNNKDFTGTQKNTFTEQVVVTPDASLMLATGGGDTSNAINIGSSGIIIGQTFGNGVIRSGFSGKYLYFRDPSLNVTAGINLDNGGYHISEGANKKSGRSTLTAGTVTIANTSINANSRIYLGVEAPGGTVGHLSFTKNNGVGFTVNSTSILDTSIFNYIIFEAL